MGQTRGLRRDALEDVVDELKTMRVKTCPVVRRTYRVHDGHGLRGDARVRVDLLQHSVDVHLQQEGVSIHQGNGQERLNGH